MSLPCHPLYAERLPDWTLLDDCFLGERQIKSKRDTYLPPTAGMLSNGFGRSGATESTGDKMYRAYLTRAVFPDDFQEAVTGISGMAHRKPPKIEVPANLEPLLKSASLTGETLETMWQRVTEGQLRHGRAGLLVDVPSGVSGPVTPFLLF